MNPTKRAAEKSFFFFSCKVTTSLYKWRWQQTRPFWAPLLLSDFPALWQTSPFLKSITPVGGNSHVPHGSLHFLSSCDSSIPHAKAESQQSRWICHWFDAVIDNGWKGVNGSPILHPSGAQVLCSMHSNSICSSINLYSLWGQGGTL